MTMLELDKLVFSGPFGYLQRLALNGKDPAAMLCGTMIAAQTNTVV